jgi:hypothetical protein
MLMVHTGIINLTEIEFAVDIRLWVTRLEQELLEAAKESCEDIMPPLEK